MHEEYIERINSLAKSYRAVRDKLRGDEKTRAREKAANAIFEIYISEPFGHPSRITDSIYCYEYEINGSMPICYFHTTFLIETLHGRLDGWGHIEGVSDDTLDEEEVGGIAEVNKFAPFFSYMGVWLKFRSHIIKQWKSLNDVDMLDELAHTGKFPMYREKTDKDGKTHWENTEASIEAMPDQEQECLEKDVDASFAHSSYVYDLEGLEIMILGTVTSKKSTRRSEIATRALTRGHILDLCRDIEGMPLPDDITPDKGIFSWTEYKIPKYMPEEIMEHDALISECDARCGRLFVSESCSEMIAQRTLYDKEGFSARMTEKHGIGYGVNSIQHEIPRMKFFWLIAKIGDAGANRIRMAFGTESDELKTKISSNVKDYWAEYDSMKEIL